MDWKNEFVPFVSKGLNLVHDPIDMPEGMFGVYTNVRSTKEGSVTARPGMELIGHHAYCDPIHTVIQVESQGVLHTLVGAGSRIYKYETEYLDDTGNVHGTPPSWDNVPIASGLSGNPLTWAVYRPETFNGPVVYVGDSNANLKLFMMGGTWVAQKMGIDPPPEQIPPPRLTVMSALDDGYRYLSVAPFTNLTPGVGTVLRNCTLATTLSGTIAAVKPTQSTAPGLYSGAPSLSVTDASDTASVTVALPGDAESHKWARGFGDSSRVEFFLLLNRPQDFSEIRVQCGLWASGDQTDTTSGDYHNYYQHTVVVSDLQKASGDSITMTRTEIFNTIYEPPSPEPAYNQYGYPYTDQGSVDQPSYRTVSEWSEAPLTGSDWFAVSIRKSDFIRFGPDVILTWDNVVSFKITAVALTSGATFSFHRVSVTSGSGLDSTLGIPYDWRCTFWNEDLGVESNPSPEQPTGTQVVNRRARLSIPHPTDPQVTHVKIYRRGGLLGDYHLVEKIPVRPNRDEALDWEGPYFERDATGIVGGFGSTAFLTSTAMVLSTPRIAKRPILVHGDWCYLSTSNQALRQVFRVATGSTSNLMDGTVSSSMVGHNFTGLSATYGKLRWCAYSDHSPDATIAQRQTLDVDNDAPVTTLVKRQNRLLWTDKLTSSVENGWQTNNVYVYPRSEAGPFGGGAAFAVSALSNGIPLKWFIQIPVLFEPTSQTYCMSFYARRKAGRGKVRLELMDGEHTATGATLDVPPYPDDRWQRFNFPLQFPSLRMGWYNLRLSLESMGEELWVWGPQIESSKYPTDYLPSGGFYGTVTDASRRSQPLPIMCGPFMGKWLFGAGDPNQPGVLFWSNANRPEQWSPANYVEVSHPGDPIRGMCVYDGKLYVFTEDRMFSVYPSLAGPFPFVALPTNCNYGLWSPYSLAVGPYIWFLSGAGIMQTNGGEAVNISLRSPLRPFFEGVESNGYAPIDYSAGVLENRLYWCDPYLHLVYVGTDGLRGMVSWHSVADRWECSRFEDNDGAQPYGYPTYIEWARRKDSSRTGTSPIYGWSSGRLYRESSASSDPEEYPIRCRVRTRGLTQGEYRFSKLYGDVLLDMDGDGADITVTPSLDNDTVACAPVTVGTSVGRETYFVDLATDPPQNRWDEGDGVVGRSVSLDIEWLRSSTSPTLYYADVSWKPHSNERSTWNTFYEDEGNLQDQWISGLYLDCDTQGKGKTVSIWIDGEHVQDSLVSARGRQPVKISFGPVRGVKMRFTSQDGVKGRLWGHKWVTQQEPVQLTNLATNWEDLQWGHEKLIKGVSLEIDVESAPKRLGLAINGDDSNIVGDPVVVTKTGRSITQHPFDNILAETVRLVSLDNVTGRLYGVKWVYDREPPSMSLWQTQEAVFEQAAYSQLKDVQVCLRSDSSVTMTVASDDRVDTYTMEGTGGLRRKVRVPVRGVKSKAFKFAFESSKPFKLYVPDCKAYVRPWGAMGDFTPYQLPFPGGE